MKDSEKQAWLRVLRAPARRRRPTDQELEAFLRPYLAALRDKSQPLSPEMRDRIAETLEQAFFRREAITPKLLSQVADMLEDFFYGRPAHRPQGSDWDRFGRQMWANFCEQLIQQEMDQMEAAGEKPRGGSRMAAELKVAEDIGLSREALQKRLTRAK